METFDPEASYVIKGSIEVIRRKPKMFAGDKPWGPSLASYLLKDLIYLDAMPATVEQVNDWWVIFSENDWLLQPDGVVSLDVFSNIIRNLKIGRYAIRAEVVIAALAKAAVTLKRQKIDWVAGDPAKSPLPDSIAHRASTSAGRIVAFTVEENGD
jgi:hypothetical protein